MKPLFTMNLPLGGLTLKKAIIIICAYLFIGILCIYGWSLAFIHSLSTSNSLLLGSTVGLILGLWSAWMLWKVNSPDKKVKTVTKESVQTMKKKYLPYVFIGIFLLNILTRRGRLGESVVLGFLLWFGITILATAVVNARIFRFELKSHR